MKHLVAAVAILLIFTAACRNPEISEANSLRDVPQAGSGDTSPPGTPPTVPPTDTPVGEGSGPGTGSSSGSGTPAQPLEPYVMTSISSLADTGLYADFAAHTLALGVKAYGPRFPLYSDGADKQRFVYLPPGSPVDATDLELWRFPVGTKFWKFFSSHGVIIETRYMEKLPGQWAFGSFVWNHEQSAAHLWSGQAVPQAAMVPVATANGGGQQQVPYAIPAFDQCLVCHKQHGANDPVKPDPVLGFSAFQLDQGTIQSFITAGSLPAMNISWPMHAIPALDQNERAVIGYLHGNCGHCHNPRRSEFVPVIGGQAFALNYNLATVMQRSDINVLKMISRPVANQQIHMPGSLHPAAIRAKSPVDSMVYFRLSGGAMPPFRMPEIGLNSIDYNFLNNVLRPWIMHLP